VEILNVCFVWHFCDCISVEPSKLYVFWSGALFMFSPTFWESFVTALRVVLVFSRFMRSMHERDFSDYVTGILLAFCRRSATLFTGHRRTWIGNWNNISLAMEQTKIRMILLCFCAFVAVLSLWNRCLGLQSNLGETHVIPWCWSLKKAIIRFVFNFIKLHLATFHSFDATKLSKTRLKKHLVARSMFACLD